MNNTPSDGHQHVMILKEVKDGNGIFVCKLCGFKGTCPLMWTEEKKVEK